jgi:hypothetical protein
VYTTAHNETELVETLRDLTRKYAELTKCSSVLTKTPEGTLVHTSLQAIFKLKTTTNLQALVHRHVMAHALKAELAVPGGFDDCLRRLIDSTTMDNHLPEQGTFLGHFSPFLCDLQRLVARYVPDSVKSWVPGLVVDALDLAGRGGKIIVEKTPLTRPHIEQSPGHTFVLRPLIPVGLGTHLGPRLVCVDGHIESVAEAHALFEQVASSKQTCLLFVRGMSDEVRHTIKVNHDRGTMSLIPFIVRFDFEGVNTLVDLAVVAGNDVVSSNRGDLIQAIKLSEHRTVDKVIVTGKNLTIFNPSTKASVASHVASLVSRRDQANEHTSDFFDARIRSMVPGTVTIRIPEGMNYVTISQAIDHSLRAVRSVMDHGLTYDENGEPIPAILSYVGTKFAGLCRDSMKSLGAAITSVDHLNQVP